MNHAPYEDMVNSPNHYSVIRNVEAIDIIKIVLDELDLTPFESYCLGNILKYRLRAGSKGDALQDLAKADKYKEICE